MATVVVDNKISNNPTNTLVGVQKPKQVVKGKGKKMTSQKSVIKMKLLKESVSQQASWVWTFMACESAYLKRDSNMLNKPILISQQKHNLTTNLFANISKTQFRFIKSYK